MCFKFVYPLENDFEITLQPAFIQIIRLVPCHYLYVLGLTGDLG